MGGEFGQFIEWRFAEQLDWGLEEYDNHKKMWEYSTALGHFYQEHPAFFEIERELSGGEWEGFKWLKAQDCEKQRSRLSETFQRQERRDIGRYKLYSYRPRLHYRST